MQKKKDYFAFILLFLAAVSFLYQVVQNMIVYSLPYDYEYFSDRYFHSQYNQGSKGELVISDYDLYSFAGYYYIKGGEVSRVNFENPPLGKYIVGASILLFRNQLVINVLYAALYLIITYWLGIILFKNKLIASLGVLILSLDPYIHQVFKVPMLDFPSGLFFLLGLLFFIKGKTWWQYALSSLFFGISVSIKFFPFFIIAAFCLLLYQIIARRQKLFPFLLSLPLIFVVYLASYIEFFTRNNFLDFIKYQWWVVRWRMGNPVVLGNAFRTIFTGRFKPWWQTLETTHSYTAEWSFFIPFLVGAAILSIFFRRKDKCLLYLYLFMWVFFAYINLGTEGGLKYLSPFYGLFALFASFVLIKSVSRVWKFVYPNCLLRQVKKKL